ncbi:hypothetical protein [Frankia sp. AiPa1]|nr:hypothetical protein [Frankia sp. AiPa1]MCL9761037.1 hypothetical protein [Frankia sp. AiPa1]
MPTSTPERRDPAREIDDGVANTAAHVAIRRSIETGQPQDLRAPAMG